MKASIRLALLAVGLFVISSCKTPDIAYFQDMYNDTTLVMQKARLVTFQPQDKMTITVSSKDPKLTAMFSLMTTTRQIGMEGSTSGFNSSNNQLSVYTVDSRGDIDFPVLGKLGVAGKTREEVAQLIKETLISQKLVLDPVVTVEFYNLYVAILGDVSKPGRYAITRDNMNLFDAISLAGDLQITGKRRNVLVMREENGVTKNYQVDLCSAASIVNSPAYNLKQGDVIYVEPNAMKKRSSKVNGNNLLTPSFWISIASFIMTTLTFLAK